jgi:hypothetical protein
MTNNDRPLILAAFLIAKSLPRDTIARRKRCYMNPFNPLGISKEDLLKLIVDPGSSRSILIMRAVAMMIFLLAFVIVCYTGIDSDPELVKYLRLP